MSTRVTGEGNLLPADGEKVPVFWAEDQTSPNSPCSQSLIQSKALTLFKSREAERGEEAAGEKLGAGRGWVRRFKERRRLHK